VYVCRTMKDTPQTRKPRTIGAGPFILPAMNL
jgi:hypothetical protein